MSLAAPTQLNIVLVINSTGTITNPTVVVPIPASLQALDSGNSIGSGQVSAFTPGGPQGGTYSGGQTGVSSVDTLVRNIFRAGCFFVPSSNTWYSALVIQSITWS
jgi:hypothetical protein